MNKPRKVEEPAGTYAATPKPPPPQTTASKSTDIRHPDEATFRKAAEKVFKTHENLFRKLAQ